MEILKYREFEGSAELDLGRGVCRGRILFIDDAVTYESQTIQGLQGEFEAAVDDYVDTCREIGKEPQKSCRGQFNVRVTPEVHRAAARRALADETSLNDVVSRALAAYLQEPTAGNLSTQHAHPAVASIVSIEEVGVLTDWVVGGSAGLLNAPFGSADTLVSIVQSPAFPDRSGFPPDWRATGSTAGSLPRKKEKHHARH